MSTTQQFLQPVINDLKTAFHKAKLPTDYPLVAEQRFDNPSKFQLTVVVGRDSQMFVEGGIGKAIIQEVSNKHKAHLGLSFGETIGVCGSVGGRGIYYVNW